MGRTPGTPDISEETRQAIALFLAERSVNGRLERGAALAAAPKFGCCRQQVAKIFRQKLQGFPTARRGRPPTTSADVAERVVRIAATPHRRRQTLRALSNATKIPKTTLLRYINKDLVKRVTVRVKPTLTAEHKRRRLTFALAHVERPVGERLHRVHHMYEKEGWDLRMKCQPPRSPDMNVLDLGFFNSIQSLQYQEETYTTDQLIAAVARAFRATTSDTLDHCFLTLQNVLETVIKYFRHNDYKLSHYRKRRGLLPSLSPTSLTYDAATVERGIHHLLCGALQFL